MNNCICNVLLFQNLQSNTHDLTINIASVRKIYVLIF